MTQNVETEVPARTKLGIRAGVSRKLLERKAHETATAFEPADDALEDSFPVLVRDKPTPAGTANHEVPTPHREQTAAEHADTAADAVAVAQAPAAASPQEPLQPSPVGFTAAQAPKPATAIAWSAEDESAFQALASRRKAAGYQRRGRDVSDQFVRLGAITPNGNTVVAVIVGLVAANGGSIIRADLIAAMAGASYPHGKARPGDKAWCQGYVAGAVRNGFLALADEATVNVADAA